MSWLKKRFSRLRRFAGLKSKNSKPANVAAAAAIAELDAALSAEDQRPAVDHSAPSVSTSQLTLEIDGGDSVIEPGNVPTIADESLDASAPSVDVPKVNTACRLPVKVRAGSLRDKEKTTAAGDNNNVSVAQRNQRWASQAGKAVPVKRPPGKLPRLDRVRPTAAAAPVANDEDSEF